MWVRLDDGILDNPKVAAVGTAGFALYVAAIVYCGRNLTDGFVPLLTLPRLLTPPREDERFSLTIRSLVAHGLLKECDDGYMVHDFKDYNPSRRDVLRARKHTALRVSRWRERNIVTNKAGDTATNAAPVPAPVPAPKDTKNIGPNGPVPSALLKLWNTIVKTPEVQELGRKRQQQVQRRLREHPDLAWWEGVFERIAGTPFLRGEGERKWRATFDWIVANEVNAVRVAEGNYDDPPPKTPADVRNRYLRVLRGEH